MKRVLSFILTFFVALSCISICGCAHDCQKDGHVWNVDIVLYDSTCMEQGSAIFVCEYCSEEKTDKLPFSPHTFDNEWSHDVNGHFHLCTECESARKDEAKHEYNGMICEICARVSTAENLIIFPNGDLTACEVLGVSQDFNQENVEVPSSYMNLPVVAISHSAFAYNSILKSITLSNTIKTIGAYSFSGCSELKRVYGSSELVKIDNNAFSNCIALESFVVGSKVTFIGKNAFQNCVSLNSVEFEVTTGWAIYDGENKVEDVDLSLWTPQDLASFMVNDYSSYSLERR